jgi:hypothetical protein
MNELPVPLISRAVLGRSRWLRCPYRCEADTYCLGITPEAIRVGILHLLPRVECRGNKYRPDPVQHRVGTDDPVDGIRDLLSRQEFDEIIISTLPKRWSEWLRRDLPRRIERTFWLPVTVVTASSAIPGLGTKWGTATTVDYNEGAEVGYRWFAQQHQEPLYPFGHGLSYTTFEHSDLTVDGGDTITVSFTVTNTGTRAGADIPQLYLTAAAGDERVRLLGFERVELDAGESRPVTLTADRRLRARYDSNAGQWHIPGGTYDIAVGTAANDSTLTGNAVIAEQRSAAEWRGANTSGPHTAQSLRPSQHPKA